LIIAHYLDATGYHYDHQVEKIFWSDNCRVLAVWAAEFLTMSQKNYSTRGTAV